MDYLTRNSDNVSVIIPYYNSSSTITRALESITSQHIRDVEVIIVDDASEDQEAARLSCIAEAFPHLNINIYTKRVNQGPSPARNAGWDRATKEYVAFLDADDSWQPAKLTYQLVYLRAYPDLAFVGTRLSGPHLRVEGIPSITWISARRQILRNRFVTSSVVVRRSISERFNDQLRYSEDNELWCRLLLKGMPGGILEAPLTNYHNVAIGRAGASGRYGHMLIGQLRAYHGLYRSSLMSFSCYMTALSSALLRFTLRTVRIAYSLARRALIIRKGSPD